MEDGWVTRGMIAETHHAIDTCLKQLERFVGPNQEQPTGSLDLELEPLKPLEPVRRLDFELEENVGQEEEEKKETDMSDMEKDGNEQEEKDGNKEKEDGNENGEKAGNEQEEKKEKKDNDMLMGEDASPSVIIPDSLSKEDVEKIVNAPFTDDNADLKFAVLKKVINKQLPMPDTIHVPKVKKGVKQPRGRAFRALKYLRQSALALKRMHVLEAADKADKSKVKPTIRKNKAKGNRCKGASAASAASAEPVKGATRKAKAASKPKPKPMASKPKPMASKPKPMASKPKPMASKPKPKRAPKKSDDAVAPEPHAAAPEPMVPEPRAVLGPEAPELHVAAPMAPGPDPPAPPMDEPEEEMTPQELKKKLHSAFWQNDAKCVGQSILLSLVSGLLHCLESSQEERQRCPWRGKCSPKAAAWLIHTLLYQPFTWISCVHLWFPMNILCASLVSNEYFVCIFGFQGLSWSMAMRMTLWLPGIFRGFCFPYPPEIWHGIFSDWNDAGLNASKIQCEISKQHAQLEKKAAAATTVSRARSILERIQIAL